MRVNRVPFCLLATVALVALSIPVSASEPGINLEPELDGTPVSSIQHDDISFDLQEWNITFTLSDAEIANNTTAQVSTQICINTGFCFPPEPMLIEEASNGTYAGSVTPMEDHTYVNWRIILTFENNSTVRVPEKGWSKTWSNCWLDTYSQPPLWGGDGCPEKTEGEEKTLPAIGTLGAISSIMLAGAVFYRRKS